MPQRRLNPAMKEVVRAGILKLLNVGIIYAILDSSWVSPVQVVPKKGGMTVVKNDNNEFIPTRTVNGWCVLWITASSIKQQGRIIFHFHSLIKC